MIPLSNKNTREQTSGTRVTTVIPNGVHQIQLGPYQLRLETRLASTIHVDDAAVATILRDYPYAGGEEVVLSFAAVAPSSPALRPVAVPVAAAMSSAPASRSSAAVRLSSPHVTAAESRPADCEAVRKATATPVNCLFM